MTTTIELLDKGYVKLIDFLGGDERVVNSARVTFGGVSKGEERDKMLIKYLMDNEHHSPFEHSVFQFQICCPIFVARQWMRHRIASYNEVSARYTEVKDEFYFPKEFRAQDTHNKQGSLASADLKHEELAKLYKESVEASYEAYRKLLAAGVAKEMARGVLPVCQYTQFYWTVNARSLMNFISLRADAHAQLEIRVYAEAVKKIFREKMPWSFEAFKGLENK
jgi:thymidylate synthase (FAD)